MTERMPKSFSTSVSVVGISGRMSNRGGERGGWPTEARDLTRPGRFIYMGDSSRYRPFTWGIALFPWGFTWGIQYLHGGSLFMIFI